jgi:hypothetical protein
MRNDSYSRFLSRRPSFPKLKLGVGGDLRNVAEFDVSSPSSSSTFEHRHGLAFLEIKGDLGENSGDEKDDLTASRELGWVVNYTLHAFVIYSVSWTEILLILRLWV